MRAPEVRLRRGSAADSNISSNPFNSNPGFLGSEALARGEAEVDDLKCIEVLLGVSPKLVFSQEL